MPQRRSWKVEQSFQEFEKHEIVANGEQSVR